MGMFSYLVGERRLAQVEQAEQEQVDLLAPAHAPIGHSVNGGEITNVNL
jgi:phosphopantothenate synthetase